MKSPKREKQLHSQKPPNHLTNHITHSTNHTTNLINHPGLPGHSSTTSIPKIPGPHPGRSHGGRNKPCFFCEWMDVGETPIFHVDNDLVSSSNWKPFILKILLMKDILHQWRLVVYTIIYGFSTYQVVGNGIAEASTVGCWGYENCFPRRTIV